MTKKKIIIGYTSGVYDLFHVGHLNLLRRAKSMCDRLIVGVSSDELVRKIKKKSTIIPFDERINIVQSIKFVDMTIPQRDPDKYLAWEKLKYDKLFVGDDWFKNKKWRQYELKLSKKNVQVIYFEYTKTTSSTKINKILDKHN